MIWPKPDGKMASQIAGSHHERIDGSGYPSGLRGEAIPITARIVSIVDAYDALVHKRVYKPPMEEHEAVKKMRQDSGTHFDPALFELFVTLLPQMRKIREEHPDEVAPFKNLRNGQT